MEEKSPNANALDLIRIWMRGQNLLKNQSSHVGSKPMQMHPYHQDDRNAISFTEIQVWMKEKRPVVHFPKKLKKLRSITK